MLPWPSFLVAKISNIFKNDPMGKNHDLMNTQPPQ
jgi:hypothetical protein